MNFKIAIAVPFFVLFGYSLLLCKNFILKDFDESMELVEFQEKIKVTKKVLGIDGLALYDFFKDLYQKNTRQSQLSIEPRIPKIVHQIWLGSPVPEELKAIMKTWIDLHPGWYYKIWTDDDIATAKLFNRELYDNSINFGQKSDIARYEILYHIGGVYVDVDTECLQSVDVLHHMFDFYVGIQPLDSGFLQLGIGVIGAKPKHPILKQLILGMKRNAENSKGAPAKTGPVYCTKVFYEHAGKQEELIDIALPVSYFYPMRAHEHTLNYKAWRDQGSFTVHHWAKTWMPIEYRRGKFRKIKNDLNSMKAWNN